ncbi:hypothetical protein [Aureitalea marina]|uniref:Lipoprotein n=1 Tax=Aureitalea marina TaxID=930804 RepID=A0A2S7KS36_9FLAO|nr:hypothetical protein [Aureitalea marina]PQB05445.1 hypothetical protein BST85_11495 [Aureitalea marina]
MKIHLTKIGICLLLSGLLIAASCKEDDSTSCLNCSSQATPDFELCRQSNGNASVNGEDTGTPYDQYLEDLQEAGASCGGN